MRCGCDAWFVLVQPASHMVAMETDTSAGAEEGSVIDLETTHWNEMAFEFADIFEAPGMQAKCKTVHRIELEPGAAPLFRHQYRASAHRST